MKKPYPITWPFDPTTAEAIDTSFDILFRDLSGLTTDSEVVLSVPKGGTGLGAWGVGDLVYAKAIHELAGLPDVAVGKVLLSGGVKAAPAYGKVDLTAHVTNTLPIANGGTGQVTAVLAFNALSPLTARGDLLTHAATNNVRLPKGSAGTVLTMGADDPAWSTHAVLSLSHTDTTAAAVVRGDLVIGSGASPNTKWTRLAKGDAGKVLTMGADEPGWAVTGLPAAHSILSAYHGDTTPAAVQRGDLIAGVGASPTWARLAKGTAYQLLAMGADEPAWMDPGIFRTGRDYYLWEATADIPVGTPYDRLHITPPSETQQDDYADCVGGGGGTFGAEVLIESYVTDAGDPAVLTVPAGKWDFHFYTYLDTHVGDSRLVWKLYSCATGGGSEVLIFSKTADTLILSTNSGAPTEIVNEYYAATPHSMVAITDRLVLKVYAQTSSNQTRRVHYLHSGTVYASHVGAPFLGASAVLHNFLSATHPDTTPASPTRGDLIIASGATPTWARLAKGTSAYVLTMGADEPAWSAIPTQTSKLLSATHTDTTADDVVRGDLIIGSTATPKWTRLAKGDAGKVLTMGADEPAWAVLPTVAPADAQYVVLAVNGTLTQERVLTGTANQITVTDNGAGSTVVLSLPQNIHSGATPSFTGLTLTADMSIHRAATTDAAYASWVVSETWARYVVGADGLMYWGGGAGAYDVNLRRGAAGRLDLAGNLTITGGGQALSVTGVADSGPAVIDNAGASGHSYGLLVRGGDGWNPSLRVQARDQTSNLLNVYENGVVVHNQIFFSTIAGGELDTNLYRAGANQLKTDDDFFCNTLTMAGDSWPWVDVSFSAGDFTASGSMTWTVGSGDVVTFAYRKIGKHMTVAIQLTATTVGGTPDTYLYITIPAGATAAKQVSNIAWCQLGVGLGFFCNLEVTAGGTVIRAFRVGGTWDTGTNTHDLMGEITFPIQ